MSENSQKVSNWKLILILVVVAWLFNLLMSFVYYTQPKFFVAGWITNIALSFIETMVMVVFCYVFYLLFFKKKKKDENDIERQ